MNRIIKAAVASAAGVGGALVFALPASALVQTADIANGAVTSAKIANGAVMTGNLAANAVRTSNIVNGGVTSDDISNGTIRGADLATDIAIASDVTRATGATGSFQNLAGDVTYQGAAGGTSFFHAGVMGHFHGDTLTNNVTGGVYHAGVIGGYSVTTSDANTGPKAGVVGFVGADGPTTAPTAGVMSVIDGDGGIVTANAAYGVQYLNSTAGSHFNYGLDLKHAATGSYAAVTYGQADIRLSTGAAIASGSGAPASSGAAASMCNLGAGKTDFTIGSLFLRTDGSTSTSLYVCTAQNTWTAK